MAGLVSAGGLARAACGLVGVHRRVGAAQDVRRPFAVSGEDRSDAEPWGEAAVGHLASTMGCSRDAGGQPSEVRRRSQPGTHKHELVTGDPRDGVRHPRLDPQVRGDVAQQPVAGLVAEAIVDSLESVDVAEQDANFAAGPLAIRERELEMIEEQRAVRHARERVGDHQIVKLGIAPPQIELPCGLPGERGEPRALFIAHVARLAPEGTHHAHALAPADDRHAGIEADLRSGRDERMISPPLIGMRVRDHEHPVRAFDRGSA